MLLVGGTSCKGQKKGHSKDAQGFRATLHFIVDAKKWLAIVHFLDMFVCAIRSLKRHSTITEHIIYSSSESEVKQLFTRMHRCCNFSTWLAQNLYRWKVYLLVCLHSACSQVCLRSACSQSHCMLHCLEEDAMWYVPSLCKHFLFWEYYVHQQVKLYCFRNH